MDQGLPAPQKAVSAVKGVLVLVCVLTLVRALTLVWRVMLSDAKEVLGLVRGEVLLELHQLVAPKRIFFARKLLAPSHQIMHGEEFCDKCTQRGRQTDGQTDRQADRQTHHTHTHT